MHQYKHRVVFIGDTNTGKTSILQRFKQGTFNPLFHVNNI
jgi:GTPase SAR1 family protein